MPHRDMFFEGDRIKAIREMIVSKTVEERKAALAKILPLQQGDFEEMYRVLEGRPMTVRFLDPPLHEFVPTKGRGYRRTRGRNEDHCGRPQERHRRSA